MATAWAPVLRADWRVYRANAHAPEPQTGRIAIWADFVTEMGYGVGGHGLGKMADGSVIADTAETGITLPRLGAADISILVGASLLPIIVGIDLIVKLGWLGGLLASWVALPIAAGVGAFLAFVWTIPLRKTDILSIRRGARAFEDVAELTDDRPTTRISMIMPVYNGLDYLKRSLPPVMELVQRGDIEEIIVVDDGSTDGTADFARSVGAKVMPSGGRRGPGGARNEAAKVAKGDILWFVDADVVVHADSARYVHAAFREPEIVAVFGSYDDRPPGQNFGSQYKNLVHHHYHQHADPEASTFWSGCGAVRKQAFLDIGGFDQAKFGMPSVEDVELGYRLRSTGGHIRLDRRLLSTHLKIWSIPELVKTDIFKRAIPWARMMLTGEGVLDDLNVGTAERLRAILAGVTVLALAAAAVGLLPVWWLGPVLLTTVTGNWHLFRLFAKARGALFAAAGLAFHQIYYLYSSTTFVWCWAEVKLLGKGAEA